MSSCHDMKMCRCVSIINIFCILMFSCNTRADSEVVDIINTTLYNQLKKNIFVKHQDITRGGVLDACGLVFKNVFLDYQNLVEKSAPVIVVDGSYTILYDNTHHEFRSLLKVVPSIVDNYQNPSKFKTIYPYYLDVFFNGISFMKYKKADFKCENGGRCIALLDDKLGTKIIADVLNFNDYVDGEIKFSLFKDGIDTSFFFSSLTTKRKYDFEALGFIGCLQNLVHQKSSDIVNVVE